MSIQLTIDAKHVLKKWSTWLAVASAAANAGLLAYGQLPIDAQGYFPHVILSVLGVIAVAGPLLIPVATSIQQKNIPETP